MLIIVMLEIDETFRNWTSCIIISVLLSSCNGTGKHLSASFKTNVSEQCIMKWLSVEESGGSTMEW